jgi:tetratricopeptide (TPR) repeat protein
LLTDGHARRLAERLGGLPLALATAGAYLHKSTLGFDEYLQQYEKRWNLDPRRPQKLQEYRDRTLYTTWDLSYTRLMEAHPDAAELLKRLAYFDHQSIWYELLHAGVNDKLPGWLLAATADRLDFESIMRILVENCFVEVQWTTKSYSMHTCVHDWTLAGLNKIVDSHSYWYAFDCVVNSIDPAEWDFLAHLRHTRLVPHAVRLAHACFINVGVYSDITEQRDEDLPYLVQLLTEQAQLTTAALMLQHALTRREKALGFSHASTLHTLNNLSKVYRAQGQLGKAEKMYMLVLAECKKALIPNHTLTTRTVYNLSCLYHDQGDLDKAEQMYLQALAGCEKVLRPDHIMNLYTVNNLGKLYQDQGRLDKAEQMYTRALSWCEKTLSPNHILTCDTVNILGQLYHYQDKLDIAEQMYLRTLGGYENILRPDHILTSGIFNDIGRLYHDQGKLVEAEQSYTQALVRREQDFGPDHTSALVTVYNLGQLYRDQGKLNEANEMFERVKRKQSGILIKRWSVPRMNAVGTDSESGQ